MHSLVDVDRCVHCCNALTFGSVAAESYEESGWKLLSTKRDREDAAVFRSEDTLRQAKRVLLLRGRITFTTRRNRGSS